MKARLIRIGLLAAIAALVFCLVGCSSNETPNESEESEQLDQTETPTYVIGETVETDLERLTLEKASLAIAVNSSLKIGANAPSPLEQGYGLPVEYDASDTSGQDIAEKGHTFVCLEYTVENLDRTEKIIGSSKFLASATIDGKEYESIYEGSYSSINTTYWLSFNNASGHFYTSTDKTRSNVVAPSETETVRVMMDIPVETENLSSPFEITFNLPNSSGETIPFTYTIN